MKKGWEYKKLGDIANDMYRGSGIKREQVTDTGIPCVRYGEIYTTYNIAFDKCASHTNEEIISSPKYFETGDILFAITGESVEEIGKSIAYLGKEKCMCGGDIVVMKHSQYPKYLSYALSSPKAIKQKGLGKTKLKVVHTNIPSLKEISIPLPPLSEQKEIVEYLDSSFAKIDKLKENAAKNLEEAKALFQSALKDALEPKKGWEKKTIGEMGEIKVGPFGSMLHKKDYIVGGTPLINPMHISNGKIFINPAFSVCQKKCEELSSYIMQQNDIVIGRRGEIGRCAVVGILENGCVCGTGCMFLRTNISICNPFFIQQLLSSDYIRKKLEEISGGATMKNLSSTALSRFAISIPPLSEQQEIVSRLDSLNEKVNTLQQNYSRICSECDALKQAILRQVFE